MTSTTTFTATTWQALFEASPALLHCIDAQGHIVLVTEAWLRSLGYARDDVLGRSCLDFLLPASRVYAREVVLPDYLASGRADGVPLKMLCADGRVVDVTWSAALLRDAQGRAQHGVVAVEDVTDKLARSTELEREYRLRLQIERHAQHLDELLQERSDMLRVLAHEVRQPLNNASAALQSAAAALAGSGEDAAASRLQRARSVMSHVISGVDNTLAAASLLASGGQTQCADTDIDSFIGVVLAELSATERSRVRVLRSTSTRTAAMDMSLMRLALRNLLANALDHAPAGSEVLLSLADSDDPLALLIDVSDSGAGFEAELLPRLFERGVRGRGAHHRVGHGLGLFIVRRVMEMHQGKALLLSNEPGQVVMRLVLTQASDE